MKSSASEPGLQRACASSVHVFEWKLCRLDFQSSGVLVGPGGYVPERYPSNTTLFLTNMAAALGRHVNATSCKRVQIQAYWAELLKAWLALTIG